MAGIGKSKLSTIGALDNQAFIVPVLRTDPCYLVDTAANDPLLQQYADSQVEYFYVQDPEEQFFVAWIIQFVDPKNARGLPVNQHWEDRMGVSLRGPLCVQRLVRVDLYQHENREDSELSYAVIDLYGFDVPILWSYLYRGVMLAHIERAEKLAAKNYHLCHQCKKPPAAGKTLLQCMSCRATYYCSSACQKLHWPTHRQSCRRCGSCQRLHTEEKPLVPCRRCDTAYYCDDECAKRHGHLHQAACVVCAGCAERIHPFDENMVRCKHCKRARYCKAACRDTHRAQHQAECHQCATCGVHRQADGKPLKRCGGCGIVRYCSQECQRTDWPAHANVCRRCAYCHAAYTTPDSTHKCGDCRRVSYCNVQCQMAHWPVHVLDCEPSDSVPEEKNAS